MPIQAGLIKPLNMAEPFRQGLQFQQQLGLRKQQLGLQRERFEAAQQELDSKQQQAKKKSQMDLVQWELTNRDDLTYEQQSERFNISREVVGLPPIEYDESVMPKVLEGYRAFSKNAEKLIKAVEAGKIQKEVAIESIRNNIDQLTRVGGGAKAAQKEITSAQEELKTFETELDTQEQIAPQAEAIAQQVWSSGYREGSKGPDEIASDIAGALTMGESVNDIFTSYGVQKPGAGAGVRQKITQTAEEIALELYNKSFTDLSSQERANALQTKQDRAVEVSTGKVKGRIEAGLDAPLSSTDLTKFVNPDTLAKFPAGTTMRDVREAGGFAATPTQLQKIADLDNAGFIVTQLDELSKQIITATDAASAFIQGVTLKVGAFAKTNTAAAAYEDQLAQFTGVISRALGGERGVLTDTDIRRVVNGMPKFRDTKAIRDFKMGVIQLLFETATDAQKRAITGRPKDPKIRKELNDLLDAIGLAGKRIDTGRKKEIQEIRDTSTLDINDMTAEELAAEKQRILGKQGG